MLFQYRVIQELPKFVGFIPFTQLGPYKRSFHSGGEVGSVVGSPHGTKKCRVFVVSFVKTHNKFAIHVHPYTIECGTGHTLQCSVSYFGGNGDSFAISLHWHQNLRVLDQGIIP